jgi:hypothetical protein
LHNALTLHSALPNVSSEDRIAYVVAFTGPPMPITRGTARVATPSSTANVRRRQRWLMRGGILTMAAQRCQQALHARPRSLWLKMQALWQASLAPSRRNP